MPADIIVTGTGHVVTLELNRPEANHFDEELLRGLAGRIDGTSGDPACRAVVLCAAGKHFCAGADFSAGPAAGGVRESAQAIYRQARRLFGCDVPIVAAVQGAAVGGGLGLACV